MVPTVFLCDGYKKSYDENSSAPLILWLPQWWPTECVVSLRFFCHNFFSILHREKPLVPLDSGGFFSKRTHKKNRYKFKWKATVPSMQRPRKVLSFQKTQKLRTFRDFSILENRFVLCSFICGINICTYFPDTLYIYIILLHGL